MVNKKISIEFEGPVEALENAIDVLAKVNGWEEKIVELSNETEIDNPIKKIDAAGQCIVNFIRKTVIDYNSMMSSSEARIKSKESTLQLLGIVDHKIIES